MKDLRIAIDGKFTAVPTTGVQRYAREIVAHLVRRQPDRYRLLTPPWAGQARGARGLRRYLVRLCNNVWEQGWLPIGARAGGCDLLYSPGNSMPLATDRAVIVIHDAIALLHPEWFSRSFARWVGWLLPRAARRARAVITDSEASRADLLECFPFLENRLHVVYAGIGSSFRPVSPNERDRVLERYGLTQPYLICVGTLDNPRKNVARILEAWRVAAPAVPEAQLVVAGISSGVVRGSRMLAAGLQTQARVHWLGVVSDEDLPALYGASEGLVYPSLYEGFGFPPLEAMACARPAIVSSSGSLREVCGDAVRYVDPTSVSEIADAMIVALRDGAAASPLVDAGLRRARQFTWEAAAAATEAVFETAAVP
jgi:glycosyltransferase involved in cell wall biosynthesis